VSQGEVELIDNDDESGLVRELILGGMVYEHLPVAQVSVLRGGGGGGLLSFSKELLVVVDGDSCIDGVGLSSRAGNVVEECLSFGEVGALGRVRGAPR
jgi:hypothetical protein